MSRRSLLALLLALAGLPLRLAGATDTLVTHLDLDHVDVTLRFQGGSVLLFGAIARASDVIIKLVSPVQEIALSRKIQVGPLWLDDGQLSIGGTPGLLYLLASRPLSQLLDPAERRRHALQLDSVLADAEIRGDAPRIGPWQPAFLRLKQQQGHYREDGQAVTLAQGRLFFTRLALPAESPLGRYELTIYLVRNGGVVSQKRQSLVVQAVHLEWWISHLAHTYPWLFGGLFTLGMMVLGLVLGMVLHPSREV